MPLYFIAITTPPGIDKQILAHKHYMQDHFGCRVALKSPAHITLVPPFTMYDAQRKRLEDTLMDFTVGRTGFMIELKDFASFPPRVIYADVAENTPLQQLQAALEEQLFRMVFPVKKSTRPFHPHVTIANRDLDRHDFQLAWSHFADEKYDAVFAASGISLLKHEGSLWEVVFTTSFL